jgi:hypothetical protein
VALIRSDEDPDVEAAAVIAATVRDALANAATRRELAALLTGEADRRHRRLTALAEELNAYELIWQRRPAEATRSEGEPGG